MPTSQARAQIWGGDHTASPLQQRHLNKGRRRDSSSPSLHLFKQLHSSESLKKLAFLRYCPLLSSDCTCKQVLPARSAPGTAQSRADQPGAPMSPS